MDLSKYKWPIITIFTTIGILSLMITIGYPLGFLSEAPDGLERVLIDHYGETWLENLSSPWIPILSFIENEYLAGISGIVLTAIIMISVFYSIVFLKRKKLERE